MARYTPKHRKPTGKPARPGAKKKVVKKSKPGAFKCKVCKKAFRTEEALATHALDAHAQPLNIEEMSALKPNMTRCPICGAPLRKRNLEHHQRFVHGDL